MSSDLKSSENSQTKIILNFMKARFKELNITYSEIADHLKISKAMVKKHFSEGRIMLHRLEEMAQLTDMDLLEIFAACSHQIQSEFIYLDYSQEEELSLDDKLLSIFYLIQNGWSYQLLCARLNVSETNLEKILLSLDRLNLIHYFSRQRIQRIFPPTLRWIDEGPIQKKYEQLILTDFMSQPFNASGYVFDFYPAELRPETAQQFQTKLLKLLGEYKRVVKTESILPGNTKNSYGLIIGMRPWTFPGVRELLRPSGKKG